MKYVVEAEKKSKGEDDYQMLLFYEVIKGLKWSVDRQVNLALQGVLTEDESLYSGVLDGINGPTELVKGWSATIQHEAKGWLFIDYFYVTPH